MGADSPVRVVGLGFKAHNHDLPLRHQYRLGPGRGAAVLTSREMETKTMEELSQKSGQYLSRPADTSFQ